jgi:flagellar motility protein MotE (MotC chaperone)
MTYDRMGRKATPKPETEAEAATGGAGGGAATPNAARLTRGAPTSGGPKLSAAVAPAPADSRNRAASRDRMFRMRVLPLTLLVAVLALGLKVDILWDQRDEITTAFTVGTPAVAAEGTSEMTPEQAPEPMRLAQATSDEKVDPFSLGKSQIELLQDLAKRREELEQREETLILREGLLAAAEHRIEGKIEELKSVKGEIEALITVYDEQEEKEIGELVSIYEKMKPKDAARIFDRLDMDVLLDVLQRMKASKTAPVLAAMDANRAQEITVRIAERRQMPTIN